MRKRNYRKLLMLVRHRRWWWVHYYKLNYYVPRILFMVGVAGVVAAFGYWLAG